MLARFARASHRDRVLELGAGCGVASIMIAALHRPRDVVAVEIQPQLAAMAERNAALNGLGHVRTICADIRKRKIAGVEPAGFDLVVANPPFRARATGRDNPVSGRRIARGEEAAELNDFVAAARRYLRNGGRAVFVFTARRTAELISTMQAQRLEPKRMRFVHPQIGKSASAVLVEGRAGGGIEAMIEPPLILYDRPGIYSEEAHAMLSSV